MLGMKANSTFADILARETNGDKNLNQAAATILRALKKAYAEYAGRVTFNEFMHMLNANLGVESREAKKLAKKPGPRSQLMR